MVLQNCVRWATVAAMGAAGMLASSALSRAEDAVVLECVQSGVSAEAAATYQVVRENGRHMLVKSRGGSELARLALSGFGSVAGYGGTYLFYENQGRSGYLLLYFHPGEEGSRAAKTLIDINLFQPQVSPLNSEGPRSDFRCELKGA